jgi:hypothetical protein
LPSSAGIQAAIIPHQGKKPATEAAGFILAPHFMPPSWFPPLSSPTALFAPLRSFGGLRPTSYDLSRESNPSLLLLAAIPSQPLPISPFGPAPFFAAKLLKVFASVDLFGEMTPSRLTTRSPKLPDPTSVRATSILVAQREAAEVHSLDLP